MAAFLLFERKDYPKEDFDFEKLNFNFHLIGDSEIF
jgi:hypothetical protein